MSEWLPEAKLLENIEGNFKQTWKFACIVALTCACDQRFMVDP